MKIQMKVISVFMLLVLLVIGACTPGNGPAPPPEIATVSTIDYQDVDPSITVTGKSFSAGITAADLNVDVGTTGLTLASVTYVSATEITVAFTGTATPRNITIQAKTSAYDPVTSSASNTLTIPVLLEIGDVYGGGRVAYIFVDGDTGFDADVQQGIITATADQSTGIGWHVNNTDPMTGATGTAIGTGQTNTTTIINATGYVGETNAASVCDQYSGGTYNDWFLPSRDELSKLYDFKVLGYGVFESYYYWSSTEVFSGADAQHFGTGEIMYGADRQNINFNVRCIRYF